MAKALSRFSLTVKKISNPTYLMNYGKFQKRLSGTLQSTHIPKINLQPFIMDHLTPGLIALNAHISPNPMNISHQQTIATQLYNLFQKPAKWTQPFFIELLEYQFHSSQGCRSFSEISNRQQSLSFFYFHSHPHGAFYILTLKKYGKTSRLI